MKSKETGKKEKISHLLFVLEKYKEQKDFWDGYKIIHDKTYTAIECFYTYIEIHKYASEDKSIAETLNKQAAFWNITLYSLQTGFFITLGKIFDDGRDTYSIHKLLTMLVAHPDFFSKKAHAKRKVAEGFRLEDLDDFFDSVYEPSSSELRLLKRALGRHRKVFESTYKDIRNLIFAHTILKDKKKISELFLKTNIGEIERILFFLYDLLKNIWELYVNGRKPELGKRSYDYKDRIKDTTRDLISSLNGKT